MTFDKSALLNSDNIDKNQEINQSQTNNNNKESLINKIQVEESRPCNTDDTTKTKINNKNENNNSSSSSLANDKLNKTLAPSLLDSRIAPSRVSLFLEN
jgi:hypothetical protein